MSIPQWLLKITKNTTSLDNTVKHLFLENPELSKIGNLEAYKRYYHTIFPESKIQIPFAHGTNSDLSKGLEQSIKTINTGAPETLGRNDMYFNLQPEASLQYINGIGTNEGTWNKRVYWPLKEVLGKPYTSDAYRQIQIYPNLLRERIPNRKGLFTRNIGGENGKWLSEYKAELGDAGMSNEEFLDRLGVKPGETFNQFLQRKLVDFKDIYDSGNYKGLYHVKVNTINPLEVIGGSTYYGERGLFDQMKKLNADALFHFKADNEFGSDVLVVPDVNPEKVRVLGSEPDLKDFYNFMKKYKQGGILKYQNAGKIVKGIYETAKKAPNPILRRKLTGQQFTNIIANNGLVQPLSSEKGSLRFTPVKPRKADFYIETEVPVAEYLPKELDRPYMFTKGNLSERFRASEDFRPNVYDQSVKVFRKNSKGKYELIPKESLDDINLLSFGVNKKPILTEKPIRLNAHQIHLPESPISTTEGNTIYLDEALSPYKETTLQPYTILDPDLYSTGINSYYDPVSGNFIQRGGGSEINNAVSTLKSKINTDSEPSDVAKSLISPAKKYYLEKYNVSDKALTDTEWGKLMQTLIDKNSDKEILFHSTFTPFDKVQKSELLKANQGYLGRGFYVADIPQTDYGPVVIPVTMPKGKQVVLSTVRSGYNSPRFLHADNSDADKLLTSLRKPFVRWSKTGFKPQEWGFWPGMKETSKNPEAWNQFIKDSDLNFVKSTVSSKGGGYKYPEIMIPEDKVDLIDMLFKAPDELKQGGKIKSVFKAQNGDKIVGISPVHKLIPKKLFELVAKRSNMAQVKSIPTIIGDVITGRDKSFYNENNINGSNEIDTYLYGKPYNSIFTDDASVGPDYTNYINKNYPGKDIKTYNTHFGDTLYIDNKAKSLVEKQLNNGEVVGGSMGRYAHAPSYIVTKEEGRPYDAGGHLMKFGRDENGNIVANMSDIYDFLPEDFNNKYDQTENPSWTRNIANNIGTPFIVRQNNIPVKFKEIVPEYKTDKQRILGDFLSQWGNTYDLKLPLRLTDKQIDEIFDDRDYGDDILDFMISKGYINPQQ